jgi:ABC-type antimicrobial peptide transport system permease subunit
MITLVQVVMSAMTSMAMLACAMFVKTIVQIMLKEKIREIGILRAMGFGNRVAREMATGQVLVISVIGTAVGIGIGMTIPIYFKNFLTPLAPVFMDGSVYNIEIDVPFHVSLETIIISVTAGITLPLLFGIVPTIQLQKLSPVVLMNPDYIRKESFLREKKEKKAIKREKKGKGKKKKTKTRTKEMKRRRKKGVKPARALLSVGIMITTITLLYISTTRIIGEDDIILLNSTAVIAWMAVMGASIFFLGIAMVDLVGNGIGSISALFIKFTPVGNMKKFMPSIIHANTRKLKNTLGNMIIAVSLVISVTIIGHSVTTGMKCTDRTVLGGDVVVFSPYIHESEIPLIEEIEGIDSATLISHVLVYGWEYNRPGSEYIINTLGDYGGIGNNGTEMMNVIVIDPESYIDVNVHDNDLLFTIDEPSGTDPGEFIRKLSVPYTTIIGTKLARFLNLEPGDTEEITINGFASNLEIAGIARQIPANPWIGNNNKYGALNESTGSSMMISRTTLASIMDDFIGNVDIMIKNKSVHEEAMQYTNETIPIESESFIGYTSATIDKDIVSSILSGVPGVESSSFRFSTFVPGTPQITTVFNQSRVIYNGVNSTMAENGTITLPNRMYIFDPSDDLNLSSTQPVIDTHYWIDSARFSIGGEASSVHNETDLEVLLGYDDLFNWKQPDPARTAMFGDNSICVVNKFVAMHSSPGNQTWVHENQPGDVLTVTIPQSETENMSWNFTVVATVDNHLAYLTDNGTEREGYKLSSKSLNYDFIDAGTVENKSFIDLFEADANVFLTTVDQIWHMAIELTGLPFGYDVDDLLNHVYVKVNSTASVPAVVSGIESAFSSAGIENMSVFAYRETFHDKLTKVGSLFVKLLPGYTEDEVVENLRDWYLTRGKEWKVSSVMTASKIQEIGYIQVIVQILTMIVIFSLVIATAGLVTTVQLSIKERSRTFGIVRAIGHDEKTVRQMIAFEIFIASSIGAIFGLVNAIMATWMIFSGLSQGLSVPIYYGIPWTEVIAIIGSIMAITFTSSQIIAKNVTRKTIANNIRYNE